MTSTNAYPDIVKDLGKSTLEIYVTTSDFMVINADIPTADTYCTARKVIVRTEYDLSLIRRLVSDFDFFLLKISRVQEHGISTFPERMLARLHLKLNDWS